MLFMIGQMYHNTAHHYIGGSLNFRIFSGNSGDFGVLFLNENKNSEGREFGPVIGGA